MEEKVINQEVNEVEVKVEEKKKFFTKKKVLATVGTIAALGLGAILLTRKGKGQDSEEGVSNVVEVNFEPVTDYEQSEMEE